MVSAGTALVMSGVVAAQAPPTPASDRPSLSFDVRAIDPAGRPVSSLSPADVVVEVDGQVRPVVSATYVAFDQPGVPAASPGSDPGLNDRAFMLVLDDLSFGGTLPGGLLDEVAQWLGAIGPRNVVGLTTTSGRLAAIAPTRDRAALIVAARAAQAGPAAPIVDAGRAAFDQTNTVFGAVRALHRVQGTRVVVLVSKGLAAEVGTELLLALRRASAQAGARVYAVVPPQANDGAGSGAESLQLLAASAGGRVVRTTGGVGTALADIARDLPGTFRLTVESPVQPADGPYRTVKVTARDVAMLIEAPSRLLTPDAVVGPAVLEDRVRTVLRDGEPALGLPISSVGVIGRAETPGQVQLINTVTVPAAFAGPLVMTFVALDDKGAEVRGGTGRLGEPIGGEYRTSFAIALAPGTYRLRVAVADTAGHLGIAERSVVARLRTIGTLTAGDPQIVWRGEAPPWYLVSQQTIPPAAKALAVGMELFADEARSVGAPPKVALALADADGREVARRDLTATPTSGGWRVTSEVALDALPVGSYDVSVLIRDGDAEAYAVRAWVRRGGDATRPRRPTSSEFLGLFQSEVRLSWPGFNASAVLTTGVARRLVQEFAGDLGRPVPSAIAASLSPEMWRTGLHTVSSQTGPFAPLARGILAVVGNDLAAAETAITEMARAAPDSSALAILRGAWHAAAGRDREAIAAWRDAIGDVAADPDWSLPLAEALGRTGDFAGALDALSLLPRDPSRVEAVRVIDAAVALGQFERARAAVEQGRAGSGIAQPRLAFYAVLFAYADALDPAAGTGVQQRFLDLASAFLKSGAELGPLVQAWVESLQP